MNDDTDGDDNNFCHADMIGVIFRVRFLFYFLPYHMNFG